MPSTTLVTGGAGFIGSHLVHALLARGDTVRVLDNFTTGRYANLEESARDIEIVEGDLRGLDACRAACRGSELDVELAALGSVPRRIEDPMTTHAVNVQGPLNMLLAARKAQVRRLVFASSSSIYGDTRALPKQEEMRPSPCSPYAVSKLAAE